MPILATGGANFIPIVRVGRHFSNLWLMLDKAHHKLVVRDNAVNVPVLYNPITVCSDPNVFLSLKLQWDSEAYAMRVFYSRGLGSITISSLDKDYRLLCKLADYHNMSVDDYLKIGNYDSLETVYTVVGKQRVAQTYYKLVGVDNCTLLLNETRKSQRIVSDMSFNVIIPENYVYTYFTPSTPVLHTLDIRCSSVILKCNTPVECHILKLPKYMRGLNLEQAVVDEIQCESDATYAKIMRVPINWRVRGKTKSLHFIVDDLQLLTGRPDAMPVGGEDPKIFIQAKRITFESTDACIYECSEPTLRYRDMFITKR